MKKRFHPIVLVFLYMLFANGCYNNNAELLYGPQNTNCNTTPAKFATDISPIITTRCAIPDCHDANAPNNQPGIILTNYSLVKPHIDKIQQRVVIEKTMPPTGPLTSAEIDKLKCWISGGALNN